MAASCFQSRRISSAAGFSEIFVQLTAMYCWTVLNDCFVHIGYWIGVFFHVEGQASKQARIYWLVE